MHLSTDPSKDGNDLVFSAQPQEAATYTLSISQPYDPSIKYRSSEQETLVEGEASAPGVIADTSTNMGTQAGFRSFGQKTRLAVKTAWRQWYRAFKEVLPIYIAVHLAFFTISCLAVLFILPDFSPQAERLYTLWQSWHHWDTGNYLVVALHGYLTVHQTAFFPLYPLFERALMVITQDPFTAGLIVSNLAGLVMLAVLYRLVEEDFDQPRAYRTVLYLSLFPTAFFFAAAYNESLFLCLSLLSFYYMRHGRWWLAGLFGFLACLTRSAGLLLLIPFCYEYFRQHHFNLKAVRFDVVAGLLIPAGIALFALYCYVQFHDALAFSHAEVYWGRTLHVPGYGILKSMRDILYSSGFLSFLSLRNLLDLGPDLLILALIVLSFFGPWKLPRSLWAYGLYAAGLYIFAQIFPRGFTLYPLEAVSRFMLEVFPAFIVLASIGKYRTLHLSYLMVSGAILFFLLTQFLTGHWVL